MAGSGLRRAIRNTYRTLFTSRALTAVVPIVGGV